MIYKVEKNKILIWDFVKNTDIEIRFNDQIDVFKVSINQSNDKIAIWKKGGPKDSKLHIIDLLTTEKIFELNVFYDFQWYNSDSILISDGNTIYQLSLKDGKNKKLVKIGRIKIGPSEISISPDLKKIAFTKWIGDSRKLCVYDYNSSLAVQFKPSMFNYSWLDNNQVVYNYGDGIKILQISNEKSIRLLRDINDLIEKSEIKNEHMKDLLNIVQTDDLIINLIENPLFVNERFYFKIFAANKSEKRIGIVSVRKNFSDIRFHFYGTIGLINGYYIMNNPEIIGVSIGPNNLIGEKIESEIQYFRYNKNIGFKNYKPILSSNIPT